MAAKTLRRLHATVGQMQKNLECSICLDLLRDPVSTKCDHQFCSYCIQSLLAARKKPTAPCPLCKKPVTKRSLTKNDRMNGIVNAVRGVTFAIEEDTGIRCTPPKGPPSLSQSSSQSDGSVSNAPTPTDRIHARKPSKSKSKGSNVRRALPRQAQQIEIYVDSDHSDEEEQQVQLATTNVNISSSFPVPSRGKAKDKKIQRNKSARRQNHKDDVLSRDVNHKDNKPPKDVNHQEASKNAKNSLLNALQPDSLGRKTDESNVQNESNLLQILDEGSLGVSKDCSENPGDQLVPEGSNSVYGNTELVADIFGVSPSEKSRKDEEGETQLTQEEGETQLTQEEGETQLTREGETQLTQEEGETQLTREEGETQLTREEGETQLTQEVVDIDNVSKEQNIDDVHSIKQTKQKENVKVNQVSVKENSHKLPEEDPYEFIASQRTPRKVKSKRGRKGKKQVQDGRNKSKRVGKKGVNKSHVAESGKKQHVAAKRSRKGTGAIDKDVVVIDDASAEHPLFDEDHHPATNGAESSIAKGDGEEITRIEGLFASQATNDSVDSNEDRGIPLNDYNDSSDDDATNTDNSYKTGGGAYRDAVESNSKSRRVTRRQQKQDGKDTSSDEKCEDPKKRRNSKAYGKKSKQKKASSDSSSAKEEDNEKVESEVSFIQDHLEECDDMDLYLDGDSQRPHIDKEERHLKLKHVSRTASKHLLRDEKDKNEEGNVMENEVSEAGEGKTGTKSDDVNIVEDVPAKPVAKSSGDSEPIVIEDDESRGHEGEPSPSKINSEMKDVFKKPPPVQRTRQSSKSNTDYVAISIPPTTRIKNKATLKEKRSRPLLDPDEEELTIQDSQTERKERNPGGAQVFFKSYKRGSIQISKKRNKDEEEENNPLADLFGNDSEGSDEEEETSKAMESDDELPMDVSDAPEHSEDDDDDDGFLFTPDDQEDEFAKSIEESVSQILESVQSPNQESIRSKNQSSPANDNASTDSARSVRNTRRNRTVKPRSESESTKMIKDSSKQADIDVDLEQNEVKHIQNAEESGTMKSSILPDEAQTSTKNTEAAERTNASNTQARSHRSNKKRNNEIQICNEQISPRKGRSRSREKIQSKKDITSVNDPQKQAVIDTSNQNNKQNVAKNESVIPDESKPELNHGKDTPTKSDWEIAMKLAEEFGTAPKQFRSKSLQRASDGMRRSSHRRKRALSLENVSVTNCQLNEKVSQPDDVQVIGDFSSEDNQGVASSGKERRDKSAQRDCKDKKHSKKPSRSKGKHPSKSKSTEHELNDQQSSSKAINSEDDVNEKEGQSGKKSSQNIKTVIPETPLLPEADNNCSAQEESKVTSRQRKRRSSQRLSSQDTKNSKCSELTDFTQQEENGKILETNIPDEDNVSHKDDNLEESDNSSRITRQRRGAKLDDDCNSKSKSDDTESSTRKTRQSSKQIDSEDDDDVKQIPSSRSSERSSGRKRRKEKENSDVEICETMMSRTESAPKPGNSEKGHRHARLQSRSKDTHVDDSSQEVEEPSLQPGKPSRSRRLRSRRLQPSSQSSDAESVDYSTSRSRERRSKSVDPLKRKTAPTTSRGSHRRGNSMNVSIMGLGTDRRSSRSSDRLMNSRSQKLRNAPLTPEPVRRSSRSRGNTQTDDVVCIAESLVLNSGTETTQNGSKIASTPDVKKPGNKKGGIQSTPNSPKPSSLSKKKAKTDAGANSDILFSEEEKPHKLTREGLQKETVGLGKGSDTTESIELAVSHEEYEEENPEIQKTFSKQETKENNEPQVSIIEQNVTSRRRKNKLSRKKQRDESSKISASSTVSGTETESLTEADESGNTSTIKSTPQGTKPLPVLPKKEQVNDDIIEKELTSDKNLTRNISGSTTASMPSTQGSNSDIFRYSESISQEDDLLKHEISERASKEISAVPCEGSVDVAASSLESETMLVAPPKHYQKNFVQEEENKSEDCRIESASGQWRKTSKRKSFQLEAGSDSGQVSKKRKSEERVESQRKCSKRSSQKDQLTNGSETKTKASVDGPNNDGRESQQLDQTDVSEDPSQIPETGDSLRTRRRSRLSGSKFAHGTHSPRNTSVMPSGETENLVIDLTPSPSKRRSQRLSGRLSGVADDDVMSPRRSLRARHPSGTKQQPSQAKSSGSVEEDGEIMNSGSLFGTQQSNQDVTQKSSASQTCVESKVDDGEESEDDAIGGSQCMFGSNPNSSSENDVEMMSEGSDDEENPDITEQPMPSEKPSEKQDMEQELSNRASHVTVTTIPESAISAKGASEQSPISGSRNSRYRSAKGTMEQSPISGSRRTRSTRSGSRKSPSSGSASTCIAASENASVSPDKLSGEPIKILRKPNKENKMKHSENSSLEAKSPHSSSSPRKSLRQLGKSTPSSASAKNTGSGSAKINGSGVQKEKLKPQKLSDIDLSDGDVDGDHDLLFEEDDEVNGVNERDEGEKKREKTSSQKTSSPIKTTKLGVSPTEEIDVSESEDELFDDKETIDPEDVHEEVEKNTENEQDDEEDDVDDVRVESSPKDTMAKSKNEKGDEEPDDDDKNSESEEDGEEIDEDDDLIPPTPPCTNNTTKSSLSKSRSTSFISSSRQSSLNRRTESNSASDNSFSGYSSSKSFVFKHPSTTHSQRIAKVKKSSQTKPSSERSQDSETLLLHKDVSEGSRSRRNRKQRNATQSVQDAKSVGNNEKCETLEGSPSLSILDNEHDAETDAVPGPSSSKSSKSKHHAKEGSLKNGIEEPSDVETDTKQAKVKGQSERDNGSDDDVELMSCSFLQPVENKEDEEPAPEDEEPISTRRNVPKTSTSDEKDYDTDSSSTSHHLNLTSASSVMSSQSEIMNTQQQLKAQEKLEKMQEKIAAMEAELADAGVPVLPSDSDVDEQEESETELDGLQPLEPDSDDATACVEKSNESTTDKRSQSHVSKDSARASNRNDTSGAHRRSQRLDYSDEESDSETEAVRKDGDAAGEKETMQDNDQNMDTVVEPSLEVCPRSPSPPLEVCPRSPSPPPPLTQGAKQKYSSRTPLQDSLQNVTKLAEQYKAGSSSSSSVKSKRLSNVRRPSVSESSDEGSVGSNRSRKKRVSRKLPQKRANDSESSDEEVRRVSQRRNVKRRLQNDSDSSEEENARSKSEKSPKTLRSKGGHSMKKKLKNDTSQIDNSHPDNIHLGQDRTNDNNSHSRTSKQNPSRTLPSTPHTIENSVLELSNNNSQTQNAMRERNNSSNQTNVQLTSSRTPSNSVRNPGAEKRSPIMEMGCKRAMMQEDIAPVVVKNIRKNNGRFSFVATGLSRQELREVEQLTKMTGCKFASMFNANTTHVIINTDEDLVCERTLKYFQGIAARVWIVSYTWIQACLKTGDLLSEEGFEVQGDVVNGKKHGGPERARSWRDKPLMHNYEICAVGPYSGLNKDQLVSLLELCGSTTVQHPTLFPFDAGNQYFIVVQQNVSHTQEDYDALYKKYRVPVISREWVLDSVATYSVQPIEDYLLAGDQQPVIDLDSDLDEVKF